MKITHDLKPRVRYGQTVHISELIDGDVFILSTWAGGRASLLHKGDRYNLGMIINQEFGGGIRASDYANEWRYKCVEYPKVTALIVDPYEYMEVIQRIKDEYP